MRRETRSSFDGSRPMRSVPLSHAIARWTWTIDPEGAETRCRIPERENERKRERQPMTTINAEQFIVGQIGSVCVSQSQEYSYFLILIFILAKSLRWKKEERGTSSFYRLLLKGLRITCITWCIFHFLDGDLVLFLTFFSCKLIDSDSLCAKKVRRERDNGNNGESLFRCSNAPPTTRRATIGVAAGVRNKVTR